MAQNEVTINWRAKKIYVVREGLQGGYMPDSVSFFASLAEARRYMIDQVRSAREDGYTAHGSAREGYYSLQLKGASIYHLGNCIVLDDTRADMYLDKRAPAFASMDDLIQYLNDHYAS